MPIAVARIRQAGQTPETAVVVVGVLVAGLALIGDIRLLWSLGAFTALVYYAITNLAAYQLPAEQRSRPRGVAAVGLVACLFLAFWLEPAIWLSGLLLIAIGIGWRMIARKL
jgi:APA family basic amino acid/polyamine antiporter